MALIYIYISRFAGAFLNSGLWVGALLMVITGYICTHCKIAFSFILLIDSIIAFPT